MIIAKIIISPFPGKRGAVVELLQHIQGVARGRPGCLESGVYEQCGGERDILYLEQWQSNKELCRHIQSDLYLRLLLALELSSRPPEISYCDVADVKGMEWIESLRVQHERLP
jgi:quinol monooxygenase YgiN